LIGWFANTLTAQTIDKHQRALVLGGIAHVGNGQVIDNAAIGIKNGYLEFVRNQMDIRIDYTDYDTIIRLENEHIYPGFIAPNTTLGLTEIEAVRASNDFRDVAGYHPNLRALIAFNTESKIIPTVRTNGVLIAQATPRGGVISGTSSIMRLDGWNWEDAAVRRDDGVHLNWPAQFKQSGWWAEPGTINKDKQAAKQIEAVYSFFEEAQAYARQRSADSAAYPINLRFEAMRGVFDGSQRLFVHGNRAKELIQISQLKHRFDIPHLVIVGGYDAWLVPEVLKDQQIPVIYRSAHNLPMRPEDDIDLPYKIPKLLADTGILFCLDMGSGTMDAMNQRNLPFMAGTAVAYGLSPEQAIAAISGNTAKILGIEDQAGLLESGLEATFFISEGDALDIQTNRIRVAFVQGRMIDLVNRQEKLYRQYQNKYKVSVHE